MPLPRRDPALEAAQKAIRDAFKDLENTISPSDRAGFENVTLENVQKAALDLENQLGKRASLRNMRRLMPLFAGLQHYSKTIEVVCNGTSYLPWLWAPIKLVLVISSDYVEAFEKIIKAYSEIGACLTRFRALGGALKENASFQQSLAVFYVDILRFHKEAYKFVRRDFWRVLFMTSWGRFERRFRNLIEDLKRHEEQVDRDANAYHISEFQEMRLALELWREDSVAKLNREEEERTAKQLQEICAWLKLDETDQWTIFDKIFSEGWRYPGTCSWVLKNPTIASWLRDRPEVPFVWLQGNPGAGKSVIAGQLVNFLRSSQGSLVVTHFCTYMYATSKQYDKILRSLLFQLLHTSGDLVEYTHREYVTKRKLAGTSTVEQLMTTLITALTSEPGCSRFVHVIIDGLDEIEADKQRHILTFLDKLVSAARRSGAVCKVLISSRSSPLLLKALQKKPTLSLSDEKEPLRCAVEAYAIERLKEHSDRWLEIGIDERGLMSTGQCIAKKADGMFLWARLVLDYLSTNIFHSRLEVDAAINTLPRELSEFYERILTNTIKNFDVRSKSRMGRILGWIAFAQRPLRKIELRSALLFSDGQPRSGEIVPSYVFDMCAPIIEQRRDSSFAFIHVSVKDYLQMPQSTITINEGDVVREHSLASLTCLLSGLDVFQPNYPSSDRHLRVLKGLHGFHIYADEFWLADILRITSQDDGCIQDPLLASVAKDLSEQLYQIYSLSATSNNEATADFKRDISCLKNYNGLYYSARLALETRTCKLDQELENEAALRKVEGLRDILANYQKTIKSLLTVQSFPGLTDEELQIFQQEFRTSAYTCRFPSCARASAGFDSDALRREHEASHAPPPRCTYPQCQYPPFSSTRALKRHQARCHLAVHPRTKIRRVGHLGDVQSQGTNKEPLNPALSNSVEATSQPSTQGQVGQTQYPTGPPMYKAEQMRKMPFLSDEEKQKYEKGLRQLWAVFENGPDGSHARGDAAKKITDFSTALRGKIVQRKHAQGAVQQQQSSQDSTPQPTPSTQQNTTTTAPASYAANTQVEATPSAPKEQQQVSEHIMRQVNQMTFLPTPQVAEKGPDIIQKWQREMQSRYTSGLQQLHTTSEQLKKIEELVNDRNQKGNPLTSDEQMQFDNRKAALQKAHREAEIWVENFGKNQKALNTAAGRTSQV